MSVRPADIRTHLQRLLTEESVQLGRLQELLRSEAEVLRGDDVAAIERVGSERHDCTSQLTRLDAERRDLCRMVAPGGGRSDFDQLLRWCDVDGELRTRWLTNLDLARSCKEHNDRNGAVVSVKLNHVHKLLTALRGGGSSPVYAPGARGAAGFAPRELGRA